MQLWQGLFSTFAVRFRQRKHLRLEEDGGFLTSVTQVLLRPEHNHKKRSLSFSCYMVAC